MTLATALNALHRHAYRRPAGERALQRRLPYHRDHPEHPTMPADPIDLGDRRYAVILALATNPTLIHADALRLALQALCRAWSRLEVTHGELVALRHARCPIAQPDLDAAAADHEQAQASTLGAVRRLVGELDRVHDLIHLVRAAEADLVDADELMERR